MSVEEAIIFSHFGQLGPPKEESGIEIQNYRPTML
jgi:hypothetical protein